jgi:hypothetical protein
MSFKSVLAIAFTNSKEYYVGINFIGGGCIDVIRRPSDLAAQPELGLYAERGTGSIAGPPDCLGFNGQDIKPFD